jgi:glycosyltransferase involved in cell wall biosynthesis
VKSTLGLTTIPNVTKVKSLGESSLNMVERPHLPRLLVFVVAYQAQTTIREVLNRIPKILFSICDVEVLVIDDASADCTFVVAEAIRRDGSSPFPLHVLTNPRNQGYGGNQKIGFRFTLERQFDFVALIHGDGQYAPELLPFLLQPLLDGGADAVMDSRMMTPGGARKGGMPLYKFIGNRILTSVQNWFLRSALSEFHSGYRIYAATALRRIPFDLNSNGFHFDTEIIVQLLIAGQRIRELPIPTHYGDEISRVNGLKYAWDVTFTSLKARVQELGLFYDRKFDCRALDDEEKFEAPRLAYDSPHLLALALIPTGARVLLIGKGLRLASELRLRSCRVTAIASEAPSADIPLDRFHRHDLESGELPVDFADFDFVLILDVIEHMRSPEQFVDCLRHACRFAPNVTLMISSANIGFAVTRLMLLLGQFNYGRRGILDLSHTRLFTFDSLSRLLHQGGFEVREKRGIPAPFPLALGDNFAARWLTAANLLLLRLSRSLFAYQIFMVAVPRLSLEFLLQLAKTESSSRARLLANVEEENRQSG